MWVAGLDAPAAGRAEKLVPAALFRDEVVSYHQDDCLGASGGPAAQVFVRGEFPRGFAPSQRWGTRSSTQVRLPSILAMPVPLTHHPHPKKPCPNRCRSSQSRCAPACQENWRSKTGLATSVLLQIASARVLGSNALVRGQ